MKKYHFSHQITRQLESFRNYLDINEFNENTIRQNSNYAGIFLEWSALENLQCTEVRYNEIIAFIHYLQQQDYNSRFINRILLAVRHYYTFLNSGNNPASGICLRGNKHQLPEKIIDYKELETLYETFEPKDHRGKRNRVMLGLMIYQGLSCEELGRSEPGHIELRQAKIHVPGGWHSSPRTLEMQAVQLLDMQEYLRVTRPRMLAEITNERSGRKPGSICREELKNQLFFSESGSKEIKSSLYHLFRKLKKTHPEITSTKVIRQSVIVHWLKGKGIRQVQYMAGHRYVSSTWRYRDYNTGELSDALQQFHPLDRQE